MRTRFSILLLVLLVSVAVRSPAPQQPSATEQEATKRDRLLDDAQLFLAPSETEQEATKLTKGDIPELTRKAEAGDARAQLVLGHAYKLGFGTGRKQSEAVKWYQKSAEQGNVEAQFCLAEAYYRGRGVGKNDNEAIKWYLRAAEQGMIGAQYNLGVLYHEQKNYSEAVTWTRKAAERGHYRAQHNLSLWYARGDGLPQDYLSAYMWILLARAARCGDPPKPCVELDPPENADTQGTQIAVATSLSAEQIAEARRKASEWLVAHQKEPLPPEEAGPPAALFMVSHKHEAAGFLGGSLTGGLVGGLNYCHGWMTVSKNLISYKSDNRGDGFAVPPSNVKKVGTSARMVGVTFLVDVTLSLTDGKKYTFVPVDDRFERQDPDPMVKALKSVTGK